MPALIRVLLAATIVVSLPQTLTGAVTGGSPLEDIPLDSWIYDAVFALSSRGYFDHMLLHTKPYTRGEVAAEVETFDFRPESLDAGTRTLVARLRSEFGEEIEGDNANERSFPQRIRLGFGLTARADQFEEGFSQNRIGFDAIGAFSGSRHFTARMRLRVDTDGRHDTQFQGEYWKEHFTAWIDQAVITVRTGDLQATFGREFWRWGRSPVDAMLISDHSPPFDGLRVIYRRKNWAYSFHATMLDSFRVAEFGTVNRYLAAHRFNWRPHRRWEIALSEVIVFGGAGRPWALNYLNPILPYYWEQLNNDTDDNPLWNIEMSWRPVDGLELYSEWMIDDFQIDFTSEPQQIGVTGGVVWWPPLAEKRLMVNAEYQRINTFVYGQNRPWNIYTHRRDINGDVIGIGSNLGTDADRITIRPRWFQSPTLDIVGLLEMVRRGANRISDQQDSGVPKGVKFPSGIVETIRTVGLGVHVQSGGHVIFDFISGYQKVENVRNSLGRDRQGPFLRVQLTTLWWKTLGL